LNIECPELIYKPTEKNLAARLRGKDVIGGSEEEQKSHVKNCISGTLRPVISKIA
jgi:hypothetical protein